jgi:hypothetical protein
VNVIVAECCVLCFLVGTGNQVLRPSSDTGSASMGAARRVVRLYEQLLFFVLMLMLHSNLAPYQVQINGIAQVMGGQFLDTNFNCIVNALRESGITDVDTALGAIHALLSLSEDEGFAEDFELEALQRAKLELLETLKAATHGYEIENSAEQRDLFLRELTETVQLTVDWSSDDIEDVDHSSIVVALNVPVGVDTVSGLEDNNEEVEVEDVDVGEVTLGDSLAEHRVPSLTSAAGTNNSSTWVKPSQLLELHAAKPFELGLCNVCCSACRAQHFGLEKHDKKQTYKSCCEHGQVCEVVISGLYYFLT